MMLVARLSYLNGVRAGETMAHLTGSDADVSGLSCETPPPTQRQQVCNAIFDSVDAALMDERIESDGAADSAHRAMIRD